MSALVPCTSCARHVRRRERACPFCGAALAFVAPPMRVVSERLGRAAIFSIGAAAITNTIGCGARSDLGIGSPPTVQTDAAIASDAGAPHTHYGGPPHLVDAALGHDAGSTFQFYGAPPWLDAATSDAALEDDVGAIGVLYGGPELTPDAGTDIDVGCSNADYGAPPCR